jgi:hypothetical protein
VALKPAPDARWSRSERGWYGERPTDATRDHLQLAGDPARSPWICQHRPCFWTNATTAIGEGYDAGDGLIRGIVAKNAARRQWGYPVLIAATGR